MTSKVLFTSVAWRLISHNTADKGFVGKYAMTRLWSLRQEQYGPPLILKSSVYILIHIKHEVGRTMCHGKSNWKNSQIYRHVLDQSGAKLTSLYGGIEMAM